MKTSHVTPLPPKRTVRRKRAMVSKPLLRFDVSDLPALEETLLGALVPPRGIAADADLLAAYIEARNTLVSDVRRFWGGIARRVGTGAEDREVVAELADLLRDTGEAYKRDAETARTPEWGIAAVARASLYESAFRAIRRLALA
jgi:hypothetical protein